VFIFADCVRRTRSESPIRSRAFLLALSSLAPLIVLRFAPLLPAARFAEAGFESGTTRQEIREYARGA
jgi:hypothetical protein